MDRVARRKPRRSRNAEEMVEGTSTHCIVVVLFLNSNITWYRQVDLAVKRIVRSLDEENDRTGEWRVSTLTGTLRKDICT
jgi:(2Fe-2S) ferredoxin